MPGLPPSTSPLAPLRFAAFRALWLTWLLSNMCLWMWSVAAGWMMVELRVAPIWVALVQAATSIPVLVLGLPFGAIADMVDRRLLLLATLSWLGAAALLQGGFALAGTSTPQALLAATFAFGCGMAMRSPAYHATVPELVPLEHLPPALTLNAVSMNAARVLGPLATGLIIFIAGPHAVFLIIGALSGVSILLVLSWKPSERSSHQRRPATFGESLRGGVSFALQSRPLQSNLLRVSVFGAAVTALPALLPLIARDLEGGNASTFTFLFAAMGAGAVMSMSFLHRLRARFTRDTLELTGAMLHALAMGILVVTRSQAVALGAMVVAGVAWIGAANSMTVAAQLILPQWVRARGMAIHQMALMGSMAMGAALWGQVATIADVHTSLGIAAVCAALGVALAIRAMPDRPALTRR